MIAISVRSGCGAVQDGQMKPIGQTKRIVNDVNKRNSRSLE